MFEPIAEIIKSCTSDFHTLDHADIPVCNTLNQNFNHSNLNQKPLLFVNQDTFLPHPKLAYEERIFLHGLIATRAGNWHDFFNAMVWKKFTQCKVAINYLHHQEIKKQKDSVRSRKRDLLTLFDECGVIVIAPNPLLQLIKNHSWEELFITHKDLWLSHQIKIITFGHAMYEKYQNPYIGMTAQALLLSTDLFEAGGVDIDLTLASGLLNSTLLMSKAELSPLPLLGVPLWHDKQDKAFYSNKKYFRPRRHVVNEPLT